MQYILALDQGTTSSRAILFDAQGRSVKTAQKEFRQIFPQPGWVEHDANEIWNTQRQVIEQVVGLPDTAALVMDALIAQTRQHGAALVLVTHSQAATAGADRVVRLKAMGITDI